MTVLSSPPRWSAPVATLCLWALAAGSLVFWGLRLAAPTQQAVPPAVSSGAAAWGTGDVARLLGAPGESAPVAAAPTRYNVLGVIADGAQRGAALIAVDGNAPRPFRVGQAVDSGYVLQSVDGGQARLGAELNGATTMTLQVPKDPPLPSTYVRPAAPGAVPGTAPGTARTPGVGTPFTPPLNGAKGSVGRPLQR